MGALFASMLNTAYYTILVVIYSKISIVSLSCQGGFGYSSWGMDGVKEYKKVLILEGWGQNVGPGKTMICL